MIALLSIVLPAHALDLAAPQPGSAGTTNTFAVTNAAPGARVSLAFGMAEGSTRIPGCVAWAAIDAPRVLTTATADASGKATLTVSVPAAADGRTGYFQAVDTAACDVSALVVHTFTDGVEACYPGAARDYSVCATLVDDDGSLGADYDYPDPLNDNYRAPIRYLDLDALDPSTKVAPNFALDELAQAWKGRWAVIQVHAVERLQDLRDELGALVINSGYRSPGYNAGIDGATWSRHMYGDGFDIDPVSVSLTALEAACTAHGAGYTQVYTTHVHCDWRDDAQETEFFGPPPPGAGPAVADDPVDADLVAHGDGSFTAPATGFDCGEPLRQWRALDGEGVVTDTYVGRRFVPPPGTATVEVRVGGRVVRRVHTP